MGIAAMRRRWIRRVPPLVLVGLVALSLLPVHAAADACQTLVPADWTRIPVPAFRSGARGISDYEVSPVNGRIAVVTNGAAVQITTDGGCNFRHIFSVDSLSYFRPGTVIKDLVLGAVDGSRVYLAVAAPDHIEVGQPPAVVSQELGIRPHVVITNDRGGTWTEADNGLGDVLGVPLSIAATPGSASAYLLVDQHELEVPGAASIVTPQRVYSTSNSGASWVQGQTFGGTAVRPATDNATVFDHLLSDPIEPSTVWIYGRSGIQSSVDAGQTFAVPIGGLFLTSVGHLEILHPRGSPANLIATDATSEQIFLSIDGGGIWQPQGVRSIYTSTALYPGTRIAVATPQGEVFVHFPTSPDPTDVTAGGLALSDLQPSSADGQEILYARTMDALLRRTLPNPPKFEPPDWPEPPEYDPNLIGKLGGLIDPQEPALLPRRQAVELAPGERKTLRYLLYIPEVRKVDVSFLFDTSGSMVEEIGGLRDAAQGIIQALADAKVHAYFGVAAYRSYDSQPYVNHYFGPPGTGLATALNELRADGGGEESSLAALYQLATGEGQNEPDAYIEPGGQMDFRRDALHVVVHGTDEDFTNAPPNPTFEQSASALNSVRALQVGLAYENPDEALSDLAGPPTASLGHMAVLTGAISPTDVDCDGDGQADINTGTPLVCVIPSAEAENPTTIGNAIAKLVLTIPDLRHVQLVGEGATDALYGVTPANGYPAVDFKTRQTKRFDVTVGCPDFGTEEENDLDLVATARGVPIARAQVEIICRDQSAPPLPKPVIPLLLPPPGAPPPPPQPPQVQSPVQQIQAQTQSQSQAQGQVGLVAQRQSQPQVAAVKVLRPSENFARVGQQTGDDLAFSAVKSSKHRDLTPHISSYLMAAALGTLLGVRLRIRTRRAYVRVNARSHMTSHHRTRRGAI